MPQTNCLPSPFRAALAICSDLDETPGASSYFELMRFLNTDAETSMGQGVNLEIGNSIYFDMELGEFSYWNTDDANREKIRTLIKSGHIDVLHSYGDLATTRAHAIRALEELDKHDCKLKVWVDHAVAPTNFGADIMRGRGDEPGDPAYHADLTLAHGIRYVWRGRVTSVIGQENPVSFRAIADWRHPIASTRTIATEAAKQLLAIRGNSKYELHAGNKLMKPVCLRDEGTEVQEFLRCNPHWQGVSGYDTGYGIADVLSEHFLNQLVARGGPCILYTHLGKLGPGNRVFGQPTICAFRRLAKYFHSGRILVLTTRRLLDLMSFGNTVSKGPWQRLKFPQL